ncbi:hypothetical protein F7725_013143 [Dissostichus mawsoni]|uniref:MALT paracaspase 1 n=1 Tax=Dissostichus mawsoni TaxID=36200 RepID=A0A7J5YR26_DISMA|nr:hypothetical protein F7725_013143 [Dissostichus mawsoni]
MSDSSLERSTKINLLKEPAVKKLCDVLDKSSKKGWRKLGEIVGNDRRFRVLELEGSPSRMLLRLMGERGCTTGQLADYLQTVGNSEALQCLKPPALQILLQPQSVALISGHNLRLSCLASGRSPVQYQWFKTKEEVPNSFSTDLVISPVHLKDAGFYICRVNSEMFLNSAVGLRWKSWMSLCLAGRVITLEGRLKMVIQPQSQRLYVGESCSWSVERWDGPSLDTSGTEMAYRSPTPQRGNSCTERMWSNEVDIVIDDVLTIGEATDKVALLIGNLSYQNHPQLKAPMVDVYDLTNLLRQLNFQVVSLLDLTETEMRNAVDEFLLLLHKGVYGLLYYAGHGYENYGNSFMVPVDAPNPYRSANCLCVQSILKLMQEKETGLNVFLLDMCRKRNYHDDSAPNIVLRVTANIVFGYATCQDAEAFELSSSGFTNGVFVKFLKKRLLDNEKITVVLDRVAEDMGQFDATKGKQALEIRSSLSERRALTDPILPCDSGDHAHRLQWAKAHELPESMCLNFDCGAQIKLGFAAEFSNVLVIYTHIVKKPENMSSCQAHVTDFSQDLDVDPKEMNRETPEETGIYLLSSNLPQHCLYTRVSSLQKLREDLVFTVEPSPPWTMNVHWTKSISIGRPLIARLDLNRAMRRNSCLHTCLIPHSPSHSPCHSPGPEHHLHPPTGGTRSRTSAACHHYTSALTFQGAVGGCGDSYYDNLCQPFYVPAAGLSSSPGRFSIPIETTDDITELQTVFINSLQLQQQ